MGYLILGLIHDLVPLVKSDGPSCYRVGLNYLLGTGRPKIRILARTFLRCAANSGIAPAAGMLGDTYLGVGTPKAAREIIKWYTKCAELGDPNGQHRLGWAILNVDCVERDVEKAQKWLTLAAENGVEEAAEELVLISQGHYNSGASTEKSSHG